MSNSYYQSPSQPGPNPALPNSHLALAIVSLLLCCLPTGIVAVVYSTQVSQKWAAGDYAGAQTASVNARNWGIAGIVVGLVVAAVYLGVIAAGAVVSQG